MSVSAYGQDCANRREQAAQYLFAVRRLALGQHLTAVCRDCRVSVPSARLSFFEEHDGHDTVVSV